MKYDKKILKYAFCLSSATLGSALLSNNAYAAASNSNDDSVVIGMSNVTTQSQYYKEVSKAFEAAGIKNTSMANNLFDIKDSNGITIDATYIDTAIQTGSKIEMQFVPKDTEIAQQVASVFGND